MLDTSRRHTSMRNSPSTKSSAQAAMAAVRKYTFQILTRIQLMVFRRMDLG